MSPGRDDVELHRELARLGALVEAGFAGVAAQLEDQRRGVMERHRENVARSEVFDQKLNQANDRLARHDGMLVVLEREMQTITQQRGANGNGVARSAPRSATADQTDQRLGRYLTIFLAGGTALVVLVRIILYVVHGGS